MERIYLWGAGDGAAELIHLIDDVNREHGHVQYEICGLVGSEKPKYASFESFPFIDIREPAWLKQIDRSALAVITSGHPAVREKMFTEAKGAGVRLPVMIHPCAVISGTCSMGEGCIVGPNVTISYGVTLQSNCYVSFNASVGHHTEVGAHSVFSPGTRVGGAVTCGRNVFTGLNAVIAPGVKIGDHSVLSAGALVVDTVEDHSKVIAAKSRALRL